MGESNGASTPMPGHGRVVELAAWLLGVASSAWLASMASWSLAGTPVVGMFSDSVWYLAIADFYRSLPGHEMPAYAQAAYDTSRFPPLYSLLIAATGGGIEHQVAAHRLAVALTVAAALSVAAWMRTLGANGPASLAALPAVFVTPAIVDWLMIPLSEPLFLVVLMAVFVTAMRVQSGKLDVLLVAALVSIAPLVRTAGIVLVVAFALWVLRVQALGTKRRAVAIAVAVLPAAAWASYRSTKPVYLDYGGDISLGRMIGQGDSLFAFLGTQLSALWHAAQSWFGVPGTFAAIGLVVLGAFALRAWWERIRTWQLDAIFVPLYAGLLIVWPYPLEMGRLSSVAMPVLAAWVILGVARGFPKGERRSAIPLQHAIVLVAAAAIAFALPAWSRVVQRAALDAPAELEPLKRTPAYFAAPDARIALTGLETTARILALIDDATTVVEPGDCVYATQPALVMAAAQGRLRTRMVPEIDRAQPVAAQLGDCRYLIVMQLGSRQAYAPALYPLEAIGNVVEPVLVAEQPVAGGRALVAALLRMRATASH